MFWIFFVTSFLNSSFFLHPSAAYFLGRSATCMINHEESCTRNRPPTGSPSPLSGWAPGRELPARSSSPLSDWVGLEENDVCGALHRSIINEDNNNMEEENTQQAIRNSLIQNEVSSALEEYNIQQEIHLSLSELRIQAPSREESLAEDEVGLANLRLSSSLDLRSLWFNSQGNLLSAAHLSKEGGHNLK